jgi:hypothetical protein
MKNKLVIVIEEFSMLFINIKYSLFRKNQYCENLLGRNLILG